MTALSDLQTRPTYSGAARVSRPAALAAALLLAAGCGRTDNNAPPVAKPTVTLSHQAANVGWPLEMTYRFAIPATAPPFADDYWVFVHFADADGEMMWTDDHQPPTPTRQWKAGSTIEYSRTMFVPKFPYVGETSVQIGLFSPRSGQRLPLEAEPAGGRAYKVANFKMQLQADSLFVVFKDGWHPTEQAEGSPREWQWSKQHATLAFRNPHRNVLFYLQVDRATGFPEAQHVELKIGDAVIDSFVLAPSQADLRKVPLSPEQLGTGDTVEVHLSVDRTFIPATIPELKNNDPRELGVRVFRAFVEPR